MNRHIRKHIVVIAIGAALASSAPLSFSAPAIHLQCIDAEHKWEFLIDPDGKKILRGESPKYQQTFDQNFRSDNDFYYAEGEDQDALGRVSPSKVWVNRTERTILVSSYNIVTHNWYDGRYKNCFPHTQNTKPQY
jgi:predicted MPP superfamily phosphohydrolase